MSSQRPSSVPLDVMFEYMRETSMHGLRYIARKEDSPMFRCLWAVSVVTCVVFASIFIDDSWIKFLNSPTVTRVQNTHYPLYNMPFPAVTFCPSTKIKRDVGEKLLLEFLNDTATEELKQQLWHVMSALSFCDYPYYYRMHPHLMETKELLPRFRSLNITDFMLRVLPTCQEVFTGCFWQGLMHNCCEAFHIQRSESGFCYSFNSLTSETTKHCPPWSEGEIPEDSTCLLLRNTGAGTTTGLEVFLRGFPKENSLGNGQRDQNGVRVILHHPKQIPEAIQSVYVPEVQSRVVTLKVSPSLTISTAAVRALDISARHCIFQQERVLDIYPAYTLENCIIECRYKYIGKMCGCSPYQFYIVGDGLEDCTLEQLICVADHEREYRLPSPPPDTPGFGSENIPMDCQDCVAPCQETLYQVLVSNADETNPESTRSKGYVDVYYKELGAVQYTRDVAFGRMQLLVNFGGIAGLFLGISLLSGVELCYYGAKLVAAFKDFLYRRKTSPRLPYRQQAPIVRRRALH